MKTQRRVFLALVLALPAAAEVDTRTVNNGNVVLESVPEVPAELGERLNRYLNTRGAGFQDWVADGSTGGAGIYITTRFGEVSQLHRVDGPGGARHQLTFRDEPVGGVQRRPGHDVLTFSMDAGGNEQSQLFLFDPGTGRQSMLTDGESRNGALLWRPDGAGFAFQSTRRDGRSNDVWWMDPAAPDSARLLVEATGGSWWGPLDWSADGKRLLIANYVSITDSRLHVLDVDSGQMRRIAGDPDHPANVAMADARFGPGGGVFHATDAAGDFAHLVRLDPNTGQTTVLTADIPWDVSTIKLSRDRRRGAFVVNEGGVDRLHLFNPRTHERRRVEGLPVARIGGVSFRPDGRRLSLSLNTARSPSDVYTLELSDDPLDVGPLMRWTFSEVGGLDTDTFVEPELIHYPTFDERQIPAFVYRPVGTGPFPVVVYLHGGPESQFRPGFSSTFQSWIAELGVAVVAPNVRGSSGYGKAFVQLDNGFLREDSVKDVGALLDWIAARPDLDEDRVAVYGGSYGGYMVLASLMHFSDRLRAGIDVVGISNFVTFLKNTRDYRRDLRRVEYGDERDPDMAAFLQEISPSNNTDRITAPLFVAQGANDPRVPVTESEQIVRAVRAAGHEVWYMNALNEGHGFRKKENADLYRQLAFLFLERHLGGDDAGGG